MRTLKAYDSFSRFVHEGRIRLDLLAWHGRHSAGDLRFRWSWCHFDEALEADGNLDTWGRARVANSEVADHSTLGVVSVEREDTVVPARVSLQASIEWRNERRLSDYSHCPLSPVCHGSCKVHEE